MAYDYDADDSCIALWRFEAGDLFADSKGGNTLIPFNVALTPSSDIVNFKEGEGSALFAKKFTNNTDRCYIADADLDDGYPFKGTNTNKKISLTTWFMLNSDSKELQFLYGSGIGGSPLLYDQFTVSMTKTTV